MIFKCFPHGILSSDFLARGESRWYSKSLCDLQGPTGHCPKLLKSPEGARRGGWAHSKSRLTLDLGRQIGILRGRS